MPTLESAIVTLLTAALADPQYDEVDRATVANLAGAYVKRYKFADSSDFFALDMGTKYAMMLIKSWLRLATDEQTLRDTQMITDALVSWSQGAIQLLSPNVTTHIAQEDAKAKWRVVNPFTGDDSSTIIDGDS